MKIPDVDLSKESTQVQEHADAVRAVLNSGLTEVQLAFAWPPQTVAPNEPMLFLAINGTQWRLYMSYDGAWKYVALT